MEAKQKEIQDYRDSYICGDCLLKCFYKSIVLWLNDISTLGYRAVLMRTMLFKKHTMLPILDIVSVNMHSNPRPASAGLSFVID